MRHGQIEQVTLLDFGIARQTEVVAALTQTGEALGTPQYMAPEQASGQHNLGPALDIFSLGCVLFECLVGASPFYSEHAAAVLGKILFQQAPNLRQLRPSLPEPLEALLGRMLAKQALCSLARS